MNTNTQNSAQVQQQTLVQDKSKLSTLEMPVVQANPATLGLINTITAQNDGLLSARKSAAVAAIAACVGMWNDSILLKEHSATMRAMSGAIASGDSSKNAGKAHAQAFWKALGLDQRKDEKQHNDKARAAQTAIKQVLPFAYLLCCASEVIPADALIKSPADLGIKVEAKANGTKVSLMHGDGLQVSKPLACALGLVATHATPTIVKGEIVGWKIDPLRFRAAIEACKPNEHESGKGLVARVLAVPAKASKKAATGGKTEATRWEAHSVAELLNTDAARDLNATIDRLPLLNPKAEDADAQYKAAKASLQTMVALASRKLRELEEAHAKAMKTAQQKAVGSV